MTLPGTNTIGDPGYPDPDRRKMTRRATCVNCEFYDANLESRLLDMQSTIVGAWAVVHACGECGYTWKIDHRSSAPPAPEQPPCTCELTGHCRRCRP